MRVERRSNADRGRSTDRTQPTERLVRSWGRSWTRRGNTHAACVCRPAAPPFPQANKNPPPFDRRAHRPCASTDWLHILTFLSMDWTTDCSLLACLALWFCV